MRDATPVYLSSFVVLGVAINVLGPSLPTLREQSGAGLGEIGVLFTSQAGGYLVSSLCAGRFYDRGLGHRLYAGAFAMLALGFLLLSLVDSLRALSAAFVVIGLAAGVIDVGGNTLLVWARTPHVGPLMNALHLAFGVGALCCPVLINRSLAWLDGTHGAYLTVVGACLAIAVWALSQPAPAPRVAGSHAGEKSPPILIAVISGFFLLYVGLELGFGGWVYSYAEEIELGGPNAPALVTSVFWAAFTASRLVAIPVARRISAGTMLAGTAVIAIGACVLLVGGRGAPSAVWIATAAFGFGIGPQFATMMTYADEHLGLTGSATAWFIAASAVGGMVFPWLVGQLFERLGADAVPISVLAACVVLMLWIGLIVRLARQARPA